MNMDLDNFIYSEAENDLYILHLIVYCQLSSSSLPLSFKVIKQLNNPRIAIQ